jgi:hypothetical protein
MKTELLAGKKESKLLVLPILESVQLNDEWDCHLASVSLEVKP